MALQFPHCAILRKCALSTCWRCHQFSHWIALLHGNFLVAKLCSEQFFSHILNLTMEQTTPKLSSSKSLAQRDSMRTNLGQSMESNDICMCMCKTTCKMAHASQLKREHSQWIQELRTLECSSHKRNSLLLFRIPGSLVPKR